VTKPEEIIEEYINEIADRFGYKGPQARNMVLLKALTALHSNLPPRQVSEEERAASWAAIREGARKYREEHPYDPANPESRVWQEELYDEKGLPR
jgi:hypothetical protein